MLTSQRYHSLPAAPQKLHTNDTALTPAFNPEHFNSGAVYKIQPEESEIGIYVYRDGPLAHLGHNHVISHRSISGTIYEHSSLSQSGVLLKLPVEQFTIDDTKLRQEAGIDFQSIPSPTDIEGTRKNMLGTKLLNATEHPDINLSSVNIVESEQGLLATMRVTLKNYQQDIPIPLVIKKIGDKFIINGRIRLTQTRLGLSPYRILMGAIAVKDEMDIRFHMVAKLEYVLSYSSPKEFNWLTSRHTNIKPNYSAKGRNASFGLEFAAKIFVLDSAYLLSLSLSG